MNKVLHYACIVLILGISSHVNSETIYYKGTMKVRDSVIPAKATYEEVEHDEASKQHPQQQEPQEGSIAHDRVDSQRTANAQCSGTQIYAPVGNGYRNSQK